MALKLIEVRRDGPRRCVIVIEGDSFDEVSGLQAKHLASSHGTQAGYVRGGLDPLEIRPYPAGLSQPPATGANGASLFPAPAENGKYRCDYVMNSL